MTYVQQQMLKVAKKQLDPEARPMVFTRGRADVSLLKQLLLSKGASVWTDEVWFVSVYRVRVRNFVLIYLRSG